MKEKGSQGRLPGSLVGHPLPARQRPNLTPARQRPNLTPGPKC